MDEREIQNVLYGSIATVFFISCFVAFILAPLLAVFLFVFVITTNAVIACILALFAEGVYLWFIRGN